MTQIVEVEVIDIRAGGVLVQMEDGRTGFIRRRELSWERRIAFRPDMPEVGERFAAKVIDEGGNGRYTQLSVCQLTDPWKSVKNKYAINDILRGEVVNIRDFGVFVQLEPGIDAVIWPRHLPLLRDQFPLDILSVGDQVQGVLLDIDWSKRQMELSINHRLAQISHAIQDGEIPQVELFREKLDAWGKTTVAKFALTANVGQTMAPRYYPPLPKLNRVLIIDDAPSDRRRIVQALRQGRELILDWAPSGKIALEKLAEEDDYDLLIIDLALAGESGIDVAQKLLERQPGLFILFTSNDPLVQEDKFIVRGQKFPFALKEQGELITWVDNLHGGYWEEISQKDASPEKGKGRFIQQLGMMAVARRPLTDVLTELLSQLRRETGVTHAMVLEVDTAKESVVVTAVDPLFNDEIQDYITDGLYYSPVRNVVEDEVPDYREYIPTSRPYALKNFFPLLSYQTYLGMPLTIPDMTTRHALFLLDEYRPAISDEVREKAYLMAQFVQIALERRLLLDYMQRYERRYTLGELLGSLIHELTHKLDALAAADNLPLMLNKIETATGRDQQLDWFQKSQKTAVRLAHAKQDLQELVYSYSRLAMSEFEPVDVNEVVLKVIRQLSKKAQEVQTKILITEAPGVPIAQAVRPRLEQVITNIILNAIQQIDLQRRRMVEFQYPTTSPQQGIIHVKIRYRKLESPFPIEIVVTDSGPGISAYRQEDIFLLDSSGRRKGHGLGLYISRSLIETMGGQVCLADSVMFIGSVFVIALPEFPSTGAIR